MWAFVYHRLCTCAQYVTHQPSMATRHRESLRSGVKRFEPASSNSSGTHDSPRPALQNKIITCVGKVPFFMLCQFTLRHYLCTTRSRAFSCHALYCDQRLNQKTKSVVLRFTCTQTLFISLIISNVVNGWLQTHVLCCRCLLLSAQSFKAGYSFFFVDKLYL